MQLEFEPNVRPVGTDPEDAIVKLSGRRPCIYVALTDGEGKIELPYAGLNGLRALEATRDVLNDAIIEMVGLLEDRCGEQVRADRLERGDLVARAYQVRYVHSTVLTGAMVLIRYGVDGADGTEQLGRESVVTVVRETAELRAVGQ